VPVTRLDDGDVRVAGFEEARALLPDRSIPSGGERLRREHIAQRIKREVWRRDERRCVECQSNARLDFDHIIPVVR
jgi:hypothetical protein